MYCTGKVPGWFFRHVMSDFFFFLLPNPYLQGTLKGFDQTVNIILSGSHERVYSTTSGVEQVQLGLYIIRGDNMCVM